jgi:DNA-binding protein HU-beta
MKKNELVAAVAQSTGFTLDQVNTTLSAFWDVVSQNLKKGEESQYTGMGTWKSVTRAARTGRNPQTKEKMKIAARKAVKYIVGKTLKEVVQK